VYLLAGAKPLEAILDTQLAVLLHTVGNAPNDRLFHIGLHQLGNKNCSSTSWFVYCARRLHVYNIAALDVLLGRVTVSSMKNAINTYWLQVLTNEASSKSTLRYLSASSCSFKELHPTWSALDCNPSECRKAIPKARLLCGAYTLQANKAVFNQHQIDPLCPMCKTEAEDRSHFLLRCPTLTDIREKHLTGVTNRIPDFYKRTDDEKLMFLLDSNYAKNNGL
jgi:hypothetical protein